MSENSPSTLATMSENSSSPAVSDSPSVSESLAQVSLPITRLGALPHELIINIGAFAEDDDLKTLRLVNHNFCAALTESLGLRCFVDRRFILAKHSLGCLLKIAHHEVFGRCIRSLKFGTHHVQKDVTILMTAMKHKRITDPAEQMAIFKQNSSAAFFQYGDTESINGRPSPAIRLIIQALTQLKVYGQTITLGIFDDVQGSFFNRLAITGHGSEVFNSHLYLDTRNIAPELTMSDVILAARWSDTPLKSFELSLRSGFPDEDAFFRDVGQPSQSDRLESALEFLLRLDETSTPAAPKFKRTIDLRIVVSLKKEVRIDTEGRRIELGGPSARSPLMCAPYLMQNLFIYCLFPLDGGPISRALSVPYFKELYVHDCFVCWEEFGELVTRQATSLHSIKLVNVSFVTYPMSMTVDISATLKRVEGLQTLTLSRVGNHHDFARADFGESYNVPLLRGTVVLNGKDEITEELDRIEAEQEILEGKRDEESDFSDE